MNKDYIHKLSSIINEFNEHYIGQHCNGLALHGYYLTDKAPSTFKELIEYRHCNVLPVYVGGSENTIYKHAYQNYNFRFVHDLHHIKLNKDFSFEGERITIVSHYEKLKKWLFDACVFDCPKSDIHFIKEQVLKLFLIDTMGQIQYYYREGEYVDNQLEYAMSLMKYTDFKKLLELAGIEL